MINRINRKYFLMAVDGVLIGKDTDMDIAVRCPICGDSSKKKNSTRLHLYTKNNVDQDFVHCFNGDCNCQNKTMYSFLKDFYPSLLEQYKRENFKNTMQKLAKGDIGDVFSEYKKEEIKKESPVLIHDLTPYMKDIKESDDALIYLRNRGIPYTANKRGKWYYGFQDLKIGEIVYKITDSIIIPLYYENKMYGFYSRSIKNKSFITYMHDANIGYKIWNWFNVDKNQPVFIFEGIFDSISSGHFNIVALMGAKIPEDRLKELKHPVFVLDNDKTGLINSLEYVKKGYYVYIQPDKYKEKDMNELMLNNPDLNISEFITSNIYSGISAEVRIKQKL